MSFALAVRLEAACQSGATRFALSVNGITIVIGGAMGPLLGATAAALLTLGIAASALPVRHALAIEPADVLRSNQ